MRRWLPFAIPFVVIVGGGLLVRGLVMWQTAAPWASAPLVEVEDLRELHLGEPNVKVTGMAHYEMVVRQTVPATMFSPERALHLYGLFAARDTEGRAIRVLVRTERPPPPRVTYEFMTIEGRLYPVTANKVPFGTEVEVGKKSAYWFDDGMLVLEPWRITVDGEVWTVPGYPTDEG